ncbi:MAG: hypothetical protein WCE21_02100 [Candidatus Babeliales bacterium]
MNHIQKLSYIMVLVSITTITQTIDIDLGPLGGVEVGVGPDGVGADVVAGPIEVGAGVGPNYYEDEPTELGEPVDFRDEVD